ncbi:hypothetical protein NAT51_01845 [Flavobacterium amniphilum]|uniref:hypothetical protein n=1 Tax=Flavobacterium amniphilum TaxID=1834035 RepID=UPI00202A65AB|nr:hypothetical protein [Flavobacterium amniphilum]MCL9804250.1 hypothetical protein [Flavobacterium amniphilum]
MKTKLVIILLLLVQNISYCCDCPPSTRKENFREALEASDIVFYGELIETDSITRKFKFRIIELFKGNYKARYIEGFSEDNNCSRVPSTKGLWILFSRLNNNKLDMDICNPSYTFGENINMPPIPIMYHVLSPNKTKRSVTDSLRIEIAILNRKTENIKNWFEDLETLRKYKEENVVKNDKNTSLLSNKSFTLILLIINILLLTFLTTIFVRKK